MSTLLKSAFIQAATASEAEGSSAELVLVGVVSFLIAAIVTSLVIRARN